MRLPQNCYAIFRNDKRKKMRKIKASKIVNVVEKMCVEANVNLAQDTVWAIRSAVLREKNKRAEEILKIYLENAELAKKEKLPICQDTGTAVFFIEIGDKVFVEGNLKDAINQGVKKGYKNLRKSVVKDPLYDTKNTCDNTPAIIHTDIVKGDKLKITFLPKGAGAENISELKMFSPSASEEDIIAFVVETVKKSGAKACPPVVVGVGIGGNFETSAILSKKSLARKVGTKNRNKKYASLERKILDKINKLNIGSQGFGGNITAFAVHIEFSSCHMASLPVAVNLNCHANRHASKVI